MMDLAWWIAVIGVPLVGALFAVDGLVHSRAAASSTVLHGRINALQKEFGDYKVQSAMLFAQVALVREVKNDLVDILNKIEKRLGSIEEDLREERRSGHS